MRLIFILSFLICLPAHALQEGEGHDCSLLLGRWTGEFVYESGHSYSWRADLDETGSWVVSFFDVQGWETHSHQGFWECDGEYVTTWVEDSLGVSLFHQYRILALSLDHHRYEFVSGPIQGPVYEAVRDRAP